MKTKCIIICNGPSISNIKNYNLNYEEYDIIAVNRWNNIFNKLKLPHPNIVIIGKNTLDYNKQYINTMCDTQFIGIDPYKHNNYKQLQFGLKHVYNKTINFHRSLWWTGIYAIQYALQQEYDEIHVFGFTCTNQPDYKDDYNRAPLPYDKFKLITDFFKHIKQNGLSKYIKYYENNTHPLIDYL